MLCLNRLQNIYIYISYWNVMQIIINRSRACYPESFSNPQPLAREALVCPPYLFIIQATTMENQVLLFSLQFSLVQFTLVLQVYFLIFVFSENSAAIGRRVELLTFDPCKINFLFVMLICFLIMLYQLGGIKVTLWVINPQLLY